MIPAQAAAYKGGGWPLRGAWHTMDALFWMSDAMRAQLFAILCAVAAGGLCAAGGAAADAPDAAGGGRLLEYQRALYLRAIEAAERRQFAHARQLARQLGNYPLRPYVEYRVLLRQMYALPRAEVDALLRSQDGFWLAEKLRQSWVRVLYDKRRWRTFLQYADPARDSAPQLLCYYSEALHRSGRRQEAAQLARRLWHTGDSQHRACDQIFSTLKNSRIIDDSAILRRAMLVLRRGNKRRAAWLARNLGSDEYRRLMALLMNVHSNPARTAPELFNLERPDERAIAHHGMRRQSARHPARALALWPRLQAHLEDGQRADLLARLCRHGNEQQCWQLAQMAPDDLTDEVVGRQIRKAMERRDWHRVQWWINMLSETARRRAAWRYWQQRSAEHLGQQTDWSGLARERHFYGFLAALRSGARPAMQSREPPLDAEAAGVRHRLTVNPHARRAMELRHLGQHADAEQAWRRLLASLQGQGDSEELWYAAAMHALDGGWPAASIRSMIAAGDRDTLPLRFPVAHLSHFNKNAASQGLSLSWLLGLARQESYFAEHARSSAGAVGVMQLMPRTARAIARRMKLPYSPGHLRRPEYNIALGSHYLRRSLERLHNNPVYATAAYNAGISRVLRWLDPGRQRLPLEIWVETIPYKETRQYVQGVLAFSMVYEHLTDEASPMSTLGTRWFDDCDECQPPGGRGAGG